MSQLSKVIELVMNRYREIRDSGMRGTPSSVWRIDGDLDSPVLVEFSVISLEFIYSKDEKTVIGWKAQVKRFKHDAGFSTSYNDPEPYSFCPMDALSKFERKWTEKICCHQSTIRKMESEIRSLFLMFDTLNKLDVTKHLPLPKNAGVVAHLRTFAEERKLL